MQTADEQDYDAVSRTLDLVVAKTSNFVKDINVSEIDLIRFSDIECFTAAEFGIVFQWLMMISALEAKIRALDRHLQTHSNSAMSKPSLKTFRPIFLIRKNATDRKNTVQQEKNQVANDARAAFAGLQKAGWSTANKDCNIRLYWIEQPIQSHSLLHKQSIQCLDSD